MPFRKQKQGQSTKAAKPPKPQRAQPQPRQGTTTWFKGTPDARGGSFVNLSNGVQGGRKPPTPAAIKKANRAANKKGSG